MQKFASIELKINKAVKAGDKESLLSLFSFQDRLKKMEVLIDLDEGEAVKVILEGLGETELTLGNDMEKGQKKSIMTLFWFPEKSKLIPMKRTAKPGEIIEINIWK
jgi:hypothetical protein